MMPPNPVSRNRSAAARHGAAAFATGGTPGMEIRILAALMQDDEDPSVDGPPGPGD